MKKSPYILLASALAVCIFIGLSVWLMWRYYGTSTIVLPDGREVPDLSMAEAGDFAGEEFKPMREEYVRKLEQYRTLETADIPAADPAAATRLIRPLLERCMEGDEASLEAVASLPGDAVQKLAEQMGLVLSRLAGLPRKEYEALLPTAARVKEPVQQAATKYMVDTYSPGGMALPGPDATPSDWRELFKAIYALNLEYDDGGTLLTGIVVEPAGFKCALSVLPSAVASPGSLKDRLDPESFEFLLGAATQMQMIFHQRAEPETWEELADQYDRIAHAQLVFVVENRAGDRYPMTFWCWYDPANEAWWLRSVQRTTSIRALMTPSFAF